LALLYHDLIGAQRQQELVNISSILNICGYAGNDLGSQGPRIGARDVTEEEVWKEATRLPNYALNG
jgi:hypothetical protein